VTGPGGGRGGGPFGSQRMMHAAPRRGVGDFEYNGFHKGGVEKRNSAELRAYKGFCQLVMVVGYGRDPIRSGKAWLSLGVGGGRRGPSIVVVCPVDDERRRGARKSRGGGADSVVESRRVGQVL